MSELLESVAETKAAVETKIKAETKSYKGGLTPGAIARMSGTPASVLTNRTADSAGYSILKAMAFAVGALDENQCKEEIEVSNRLQAAYKSYGGYTPGFGGKVRSFLVPAGTDYLPTRHNDGSEWGEMKALKAEVKGMLAASAGSYADPEYASWFQRKTLGTTDATAGGSFIPPPQLGELIDLQRKVEAFSQAGATNTELPPNGRIEFPKLTGASTGYWVGEGAAVTESTPSTGALTLNAKKLGALVRYNSEWLRFSNGTASEQLVRNDMARVLGLTADAAMFDGVGGTRIKGLLTYDNSSSWSPGTDKVLLNVAATTGTDGNTFSAEDVYTMEQILPDEVKKQTLTWIFHNTHFGVVRKRRAGSGYASDDGKGLFLFDTMRDQAAGSPQQLNGHKVVTSSNVPNNRAKGSATNLVPVILGNFADWIIARAGVIEFAVNMYDSTGFPADQVFLRALQFIDAGPRHLASFCYEDTLLPTT